MQGDPNNPNPLSRVKLIFRYMSDAERFYATVNGSMFLGARVHLSFKDPNMNYTNTSGAKAIVVKHIPLGTTSLDLYDAVREYGRIINCKVMLDRSGVESYALVQFENQDHAERCLSTMNGSMFRGMNVSMGWQFPKNTPYQYPTQQQPHQHQPRASAAHGWGGQPTPPNSPPANNATVNASQPRPRWSSYNSNSSITSSASTPLHAWDIAATEKPSPTITSTKPSVHAAPFTPSDLTYISAHQQLPTGVLDERNLYVKNLAEGIDNLELFHTFRHFGRIISARVMRDEEMGISKGFGFVSFEDKAMAAAAIAEMNGRRVQGKPLVVNVAEPRGLRHSRLAALHSPKAADE
ncbi:hypothetical protein DFS34DRAFT_92406 [Phlyctochytrium arcticum]|nr:hypothetical protein DFS34DRAFT_92406 [Phlyctochytrium arcticum]